MMTSINETIIKKLYSNSTTLAISAIDEISQTGNSQYIPMLIDTLNSNTDPDIQKKIHTLLCEIKHNEAAAELVKAIENNKYSNIQQTLISACWENGLDYTPYLSTFVKLLINGDYMTAFEAFTVIENSEGMLSQTSMNEYLQQLRSALDGANDERKHLIHQTIQYLPSLLQAE
jgi:hypothetical protein